MKGNQFEYILGNLSFAFLLLSMLLYWFQASFESGDPISSDGVISLPSIDSSERCFEKGEPPKGNSIDIVSSPVRAAAYTVNNTSACASFVNPPVPRREDFVDTSYACPEGEALRAREGTASKARNDKSNKKIFLKKLPSLAMWSANIALASMLLLRWLQSGHFPLSNLYESLLFLSWSFTTIHFFLERAFYQEKMDTPALGAVTSPIALFTNAFATFSLPQEMQKSTVLVPALQSNWLMMHVSVMMVSYAALLSGSLLAMAFLVIQVVNQMSATTGHIFQNTDKEINKTCVEAHKTTTTSNPIDSIDSVNNTSAFAISSADSITRNSTFLFFNFFQGVSTLTTTLLSAIPMSSSGLSTPLTSQLPSRVQSASPSEQCQKIDTGPINYVDKIDGQKISTELGQTLDNLSYRSIGLGFALLTIGILSGAVWANEAWGSYWSWDPKETWAFVTWLIFAFYLHTRLSRGWTGKKSAFVATFGFLIVWFCYLGVNLFGKGLHSYGWFT